MAEKVSVSPHPPSIIGIESEKELYLVAKNPLERGRTSLTFTVANRIGILKECLEVFSRRGISLSQIESKPSINVGYDFYVEVDSTTEEELQDLVSELCSDQKCKKVLVMGKRNIAQLFWYPQRISDLDFFSHTVLQYGAELDSDHPGFTDTEYRKRRLNISAIASNYKHGQEIPDVEYTKEEIETWGIVYRNLTSLYPTHACKQHQRIFSLLEEKCGYSPNSIPQLQDVSSFLKHLHCKKECTGWTLRPVSGLLSPRDFLNGLAFRVFHSTQYIRHYTKPLYTPEPDVCHELLGHVPLFADPDFADFSQEIGIASLGVSDDDIEKLATCYWFTVEFGLCKQFENGKEEVRAFGAGILSSFGELEYSLSETPKKLQFDPFLASRTTYPVTSYQPLYFVAESFESAKLQMIEFSRSLGRPFELYYNPFTQSVEKLDSPEVIAKKMKALEHQLSTLSSSLIKLSTKA